jgi:hypothetical protein
MVAKEKGHMSIKRIQKIEVRCSLIEKSILKSKAAKAGLTLSSYLRKVGLNQKIESKLTSEEIEIYKDLHQYHSHFTRIRNLLKNKDSTFAREIINVANLIKQNLKKFQ